MAKKLDPRKFMQLAIDEMKKSIDENRADGKATPKVGALLISPEGEILGMAHRGELREGDHAEYTLLDRKLRNKNVTGCYLFATLEPCAEGSRKHPKMECSQRIVNARIKKVWVGIEDPDPTVAGKGIRFLIASGIEVEMFEKDLQDIVEMENKQFLKEAITRAQEGQKPKRIDVTPLEKVIDSTTIDEFSQEALKHYISRAKLKMETDSLDLLALLEQQQLIQYETSASSTTRGNESEEFRRNDVMPFFAWQSGMTGSGAITDKFKNNGDRANILSFREFDDNKSFVQIRKGWVEKGQEWKIEGQSKTGEVNNELQGYHVEIFFEDRDKRQYRWEISRNGGGGRPTAQEPELIQTIQSKYKPTGLGILLFGKNPRVRYPQAVLKVEARYGKSEPEIHDFTDALVLIPDKVEEWLKKVLSSRISRDQFARRTEYDYPIKVLREAIINALVHRDYEIEGAKCYLIIDEDSIVVKSPGLPVKPIRFEDFKEFKAPSLSRNPKLMAVFNAMNYVEERGIGMREMKSLPEEYNLPRPEITWQDPYINIAFPRTHQYIETIVGTEIYRQLNEEERIGLVYIQEREQVSKSEYARNFDFNDKKAQRHLARFVEFKLIKQVGKGPATKYVFIKDDEKSGH